MRVDDFERFLTEVHGYAPFPWQSAVVAAAVERGTWPAMIDIPTGLGKTSMLDVAVFLLALSSGGQAPAGLGRRRIYLVVDRRIVVDQAEEHGRRIAAALAAAEPGTVCADVATRLRRLSGAALSEPALQVVKMRGGVTWDAAWLPRPDLPAIVTGTVDQVGSRLFFRGYGVSPRRRSIDAALVGTDSVVMIDEAHVAQAFTASLDTARKLDTSAALGLPATSVIYLSATNAEHPDGWVAPFDEAAHLSDPVSRQRLHAPKQVTLLDSSEKAAIKDLAGQATTLAANPGQRVLVVCNTVDRAREVHAALAKSRRSHSAETLLLTGRSRPLDREPITDGVIALFGAGREATDEDETAILVATQTIEVGIDLDATAMVTETASWDALVQRIGRVNRRGVYDQAPIIVVEDGAKEPPVYGAAKIATADFLRKMAPLDVSALALRRLQVPDKLTSPRPAIPLLLPAHLDAWVRTSPAPTNDPPLAPYLHGIDRSTAPVTIVWRDGLLVDGGEEPLPAAEAAAMVEAIPVRSEECVEISISAARAWLAEKASSIADLDDDLDGDIPFADTDSVRRVLRRRGDADWEWVAAEGLRPGDLVVAPTQMGGLDRFGWAPLSTDPVRDLAELAALRRGVVSLRLDAGLAGRLGLPEPAGLTELVADWRNADDPQDRGEICTQLVETVVRWLGSEPAPERDSRWTHADLDQLRQMVGRGELVLTSTARRTPGALYEEAGMPVLRTVCAAADWQEVDESTTADSSSLRQRVSLATHLAAVAERAAQIAANLGLPQDLSQMVVDAARWHDLGKVDPRFQAMLFAGSAIAAELADEPLAKSGMAPGDRMAHRRAAQLSGMPRGARHEAWSEAIVAAHLGGLPEPYPGDEDLVRHLVASHHGHARPLLPPVDDRGKHSLDATIADVDVQAQLPIGVRLSDADRFASLNARYGRWGLALLEAVLRCADMTVSSEGS